MASIEIPLHTDPADYEPKPVFGKFSYRGGLTILAVLLVEAPLAYVQLKCGFDVPVELIGLIAMIPVIPIALVGVVKRHGLFFEKWWPAMRREAAAPSQLAYEPPSVVLHGMPRHDESRRERRLARREERADRRARRRARKAEMAEDQALAAEFAARFGRDTSAPSRRGIFGSRRATRTA